MDAHDEGPVPRNVLLTIDVYFGIVTQSPVRDLAQTAVHELRLHLQVQLAKTVSRP